MFVDKSNNNVISGNNISNNDENLRSIIKQAEDPHSEKLT